MNLTEIAKRTYRKRGTPRRSVFVIYDKKAKKYRRAQPLGKAWWDDPEDATFYTSSTKAQETINNMVEAGYGNPVHKDAWWHYYRELDPNAEMELEWGDVGKYFEIQEIVIQSTIRQHIDLG